MIQWTAEKDQIILKGIFKFYNIKNSAPLLQYLADQIGGECTSKAVSHRLANIRNHGKPLPASTGNTPVKPATTPKTPGSRAKATPKAPRSLAKATTKKARAPVDSESESGVSEGLLESPSPSIKRTSRKRRRSASKVAYAETDGSDVTEEEYIPFGGTKKIKREYAEEQGNVESGYAPDVEFDVAEEV